MSASEEIIENGKEQEEPIINGVTEETPHTNGAIIVEDTISVKSAEPENASINGVAEDISKKDAAEEIQKEEEKPATNGTSDTKKEESAPKTAMKTVEGVCARLKNDTSLPDSDKIDTLCLLVQRIVEENNVLKGEITIVGEQCEKQREAKEAIKTLNEAYKKQIELVREESHLRLEEEQAKRQAGMGGYTSTMTELSSLLETHTAQNSKLRDQNTGMGEQMKKLINESEKRDEYVKRVSTEAQLQITLLQHQVQKAQIEKAEIKADMTKERLEISQDLLLEKERTRNLEEQVRLFREQAETYQAQMEELQAGAGQSNKSFQHFKTQIDKLTNAMGQLEKDTQQWRQKYEVSSGQVKKMNTASMEREKEVTALKKKLDSMVKLNKTLTEERASLQKKIKPADVK